MGRSARPAHPVRPSLITPLVSHDSDGLIVPGFLRVLHPILGGNILSIEDEREQTAPGSQSSSGKAGARNRALRCAMSGSTDATTAQKAGL